MCHSHSEEIQSYVTGTIEASRGVFPYMQPINVNITDILITFLCMYRFTFNLYQTKFDIQMYPI